MSKFDEEIKRMKELIYENQKPINESSLSRVWKHIQNDGSFGVISPFRRERSSDENIRLYTELKKDVRDKGYGYIELLGGFVESGVPVEELSLFIPNVSKEDLMNWGRKYGQYSVIFKDKDQFVEIGTNEDAGIGEVKNDFVEKGWDKNLNFDSDLTKEFFSSLVKGKHKDKKFLFNLKEMYLSELVELSFNEVAYKKKKWLINNKIIRLL